MPPTRFTRSQAKGFMAKGYSAIDSQREAESPNEALQSLKDLTAFLRG